MKNKFLKGADNSPFEAVIPAIGLKLLRKTTKISVTITGPRDRY